MDLLTLSLKTRKAPEQTFEEYILKNYGPSLYNVFFRDFTAKFLSQDPSQIHSEWAKEGMKRTIIDERIGSHNLLDVFKLFFRFRPLKTEFLYPKGGIGVFCDNLASKIMAKGQEIANCAPIEQIKTDRGAIKEITFRSRRLEPDFLVWTGDLLSLSGLLNLSSRGLEYLSLILFNFELKNPVRKDFQWCYYGSKEIIFSRVTIPSSFCKSMSVRPGCGLCVEVSCRKGSCEWEDPSGLVERVKRDLITVGLVDSLKDFEGLHIEKINNAYPVYTKDYPARLKKLKEDLSGFKNLVLAGRTGLFWYNNMDDCIENGLKVAKLLY